MKELPVINLAPAGPKQREWGKPQSAGRSESPQQERPQQGFGKGAQGYNKPVGFVKGGESTDGAALSSRVTKTDEELESERKEARRRDEENSFRDVSAYYSPFLWPFIDNGLART